MDNNKQKEYKLREAANRDVEFWDKQDVNWNWKPAVSDVLYNFAKSDAAKLYHSKKVDLTELKEKFYKDFKITHTQECWQPSNSEIWNLFLPYLQQPAKSEWINSEVPKDRKVIRWHKVWKVPTVVFYNDKLSKTDGCVWVESTMTNTWPEESFEANKWMEIPQTP